MPGGRPAQPMFARRVGPSVPAGFLDALNAEPWEQTHRLVFADWCQENALSMWEQQLRLGPPPLGLMFFGSGYGNGYGDGNGYGICCVLEGGRTVPEVGLNQLIVLPHGWVICGFVAEQIGPYQFRVERSSLICRTGGTPWDDLANGKGREKATYRTWGDTTIGPQFVISRAWKGKLPSEG